MERVENTDQVEERYSFIEFLENDFDIVISEFTLNEILQGVIYISALKKH